MKSRRRRGRRSIYRLLYGSNARNKIVTINKLRLTGVSFVREPIDPECRVQGIEGVRASRLILDDIEVPFGLDIEGDVLEEKMEIPSDGVAKRTVTVALPIKGESGLYE
jgi:hypothetical protein